MKLRAIFRFEFAYQTRRGSTWICFAVLFGFALWMMVGSIPTDDNELLNSPFGIAFATVLGSVIWLLFAASVAGEAAARDVQTRMHSLIYTAPVSKAEVLGGRFLAVFVLHALILLAVPAGLLLGLYLPGVEAERLGPFRPAAYLTAYGFIALPFAFVATVLQFSAAALNRRPIASYLTSVLLLITSTFVALTVAQVLGRWELTRLLDLVGLLGIVGELGETWTAVEKNTRLVGLDPTLLANRLIWLAIAVGVLAFTYHHFRLAHPTERTQRRLISWRRDAQSASPAGTGRARSAPITIPQAQQTFGHATYARQALAIAWTSFQTIAKSRGGLVLLTVIPTLVVVVVPENLYNLGAPWLPRTEYLLTFLTSPLTNPFTPWVIIPLLIVLYAGELAWREREAGLGEITDAAPVPAWALLLGKFLGLSLVLVVFLALLTLAGVLVQVILGYQKFEIGLYLKILFGLQLAEYLLFAWLALVVQALVNQKYVGQVVTLVAYAFIAFASSLGIEHHLLVYGSSPGWSYSDMRGFGSSLGPWLWFKLYWAAWALLLAVVARLLWVRGREEGVGARLRMARRRFTRPTVWAAAVAVGLLLTLGGFIFYHTNVLNEYTTASDRRAWRAEYERRYGQYEWIPQPRLTGVNLHVEIYPDQRKAEIRGVYRLVNNSTVPIDSIHLATALAVETGVAAFDRPAALVLADEAFGHRIYALADPLPPGGSLAFSFEVRYSPRGFQNDGVLPVDASVAANGTFFTNQDWLPAIGYQAGRALNEAGLRRAHGLAPRPFFRPLYDVAARQDALGEESITFEAVVGTDADQIAVAPGALRQTWTKDERRYFHYTTDAPIGNEYAFFSADYAVREGEWKNPDGSGQVVAIRIFHHPGHTTNLDRMLHSVRASLNYDTEQFGAYPYRHITLVERPGLGGMHAYASLITFQAGFSLFAPAGEPHGPDLPFSVVAHEVAHQWWGSDLAPVRVEGNPLLAESLAQYAAYQVVKKTYGQEHLRRLLRSERREEGPARPRADVPLLRANNDFHAYRKGPWALYALSESIGAARVNRALRRLLAQHGSGALVTTLDLYRELEAVTPDSLQYLLHDLFEVNTFWEFATEGATAEQSEAGTWQVTLNVQARKVVVDEAGIVTEVPMDDWVEIGVFAPVEDPNALGESLYLQLHRIRSGEQTMTVTVPRKPALAGIDPHHLLDWEVGEDDDNIKKLKMER